MVTYHSQPSSFDHNSNPDPKSLTFLYGLIELRNLYHSIGLEIPSCLSTIYVGFRLTVSEIWAFGIWPHFRAQRETLPPTPSWEMRKKLHIRHFLVASTFTYGLESHRVRIKSVTQSSWRQRHRLVNFIQRCVAEFIVLFDNCVRYRRLALGRR